MSKADSSRASFILTLRDSGYTLQEIANRLHLSPERIRQIEAKAERVRSYCIKQLAPNLELVQFALKNHQANGG